MKRLFILLLFVSTLAGAQQRFSCDFTVVDSALGTVVVSGNAFVQGSSYRCETDGGVMYCNGTDRWIYNAKTNELVIQPSDISMFSNFDINKVKGTSYTYEYDKYKVVLTKIVKVTEPWSATFFIIDPELFDVDTIITDLRQ